MSNVNPSNLLPLRDAITTTLISEMVSGRIAGVQAIGKVWLNETSVYPYISIWPAKSSERIEANHRKRNTIKFAIGLAVKSQASIEDAYDQLFTMLDDSNGNGLQAILRDPENYSWGNLATYSEITNTDFYDSLGENRSSASTIFVAYAVMEYTTIQLMQITGAFR